jgi:uncharacterized protein (TIGR03083 family)
MQDLHRHAADERADLLALLEQLSPEQWESPTLCAAWSVRDVVAHVYSFEELAGADVFRAVVRGGFDLDRINDVALQRYAAWTPDELLVLARRNPKPHGLTAGFRGAIGLVDAMVHHQDIRRPLSLPREIPPDRLRPVLDFTQYAVTVGGPARRRGLRLVATDLDWATGSGAEVRGTGEALLMAIAGRNAPLGELSGPGVATLTARLGGA